MKGKKKGYYIFFGSNSDGVIRKIDMQIKELSKFFDVTKIQVPQKSKNHMQKIISCLPFAQKGYLYHKIEKEIDNPDFIYLRRMTADNAYVAFFTNIRSKYPKCKILIEIPSYPYLRDSYFHNFRHLFRSFPDLIKDLIYTKKLKKSVDRIVTFSEDDEIYKIPTIKSMNGIDVQAVQLVQSIKDDIQINMISVAMIAPHHGYERVIEGLHDYYCEGGNMNLVYHCVGYGSEIKYYKELTKEYHLEKHVIFYGKKSGSDLEDIYSKMHLGLDCFGLYKDKRYYVSSIKAREYLAKGLPVVSGVRSDVFERYPTDYYLEFPNDNSPLDMKQIIIFYNNVYKQQNIHENIREYAKKTIDNSVVMKEIVDFISV